MPRGIPNIPTKTMPCKFCHKPITVGAKQKKQPHHLECGIKHAVEIQTQMFNKRGPYYDRWLAGMSQWISRESTGSAGGSENDPDTGGE